MCEYDVSFKGRIIGSTFLHLYRVAHLVADNLLLTSNWELRFSMRILY